MYGWLETDRITDACTYDRIRGLDRFFKDVAVAAVADTHSSAATDDDDDEDVLRVR